MKTNSNFIKSRPSFYFLIILAMTSIFGCAPQNFGIETDAFISLEYENTNQNRISQKFISNLIKFSDSRKIKNRVGYNNNATYRIKEDPSVILTNALSLGLKNEGIGVVKFNRQENVDNRNPIINGDLKIFYADTFFTNTLKPYIKANIVLGIEIIKDGKAHNKLFSESTKHYTYVGYANDWKLAFETCLSQLVPRIASEISNIIEE